MRLRSLLVFFALSSCGLAAHADGVGTSVTGGLFFSDFISGYGTTNYFNPAQGYVPAGDGNTAGTTVTIGAGTEFGYDDGANLNTADFTGSTLTISDVDTYGAYPFEMIFTDTAFTGFMQLTNMSGFTYTFSGDTLKVFFDGLDGGNPGTFTTTFSYTTPQTTTVTPEPSGLILLGTSALGLFGVARRRFVGNR
jgi:hypothetical protein